jgi:hypothetical protein
MDTYKAFTICNMDFRVTTDTVSYGEAKVTLSVMVKVAKKRGFLGLAL